MCVCVCAESTSVHVPLWVTDEFSDIRENGLSNALVQDDGVDGPPLARVAKLSPF